MTHAADQPPGELSSEEFRAHQVRRRKQLWSLLGDLPWDHKPREPKVVKVEKRDGYQLEHLGLDLNGLEPVPALLLLPDKRPTPAPGLLYIHAHGGTYELGKEELLRGRDMLPAYAPVLAERGIVTLAIDSWCFSERQHAPAEQGWRFFSRQHAKGQQGEHDAFKLMLWRGRVLWGMMMFDEHRALDYLAGRKEVDPQRLGVFGMSMGSTKAWWLAALDERVKLCAELCCLTDYEELIQAGNLRGHGIYYYVPGLLKHFQAHEINELIVPRQHISLNGRRDALTPPRGVERIRDHLLPLYKQHGRGEDCQIELFDCGHEETPDMRKKVIAALERL